MNKLELHWIAGILEGEGSFMAGSPSKPNTPKIQIQMSDEDIIKRVADLLGNKYTLLKRRKSHWKDMYLVQLYGSKAVKLMKKINPLMGERRRIQINKAIKSYRYLGNRILTGENKKDIFIRLENKEKHIDIAKIYKVERSTISKLLSRK